MKCVLSVKESNFNEKKIKFFTVVRAEITPPYGQPERKISAVFYESPKENMFAVETNGCFPCFVLSFSS